MSIILSEGHKEHGEVEFGKKHPDIFSSYLAARLVERLAFISFIEGYLKQFRADLSVQSYAAGAPAERITRMNIAGQLAVPSSSWAALEVIVREEAIYLLDEAGYLRDEGFTTARLHVDVEGVIGQTPNLNSTTLQNRFADTCVVYGHYIASPFGINGTFPSLELARQIDQSLDKVLKEGEIPELRPDGKVHVSVRYTGEGFVPEKVYLSVATAKDTSRNFRQKVKEGILRKVNFPGLENAQWEINGGGNFTAYFLNADFGVSKAKDDVIITGGIHQLGTDRVWGKCLYKASSTLVPYTFALSRAVCEITGAGYASVGAYSQYGQPEALLQLQEIDPRQENMRREINRAFTSLPRDREGIRDLTEMPIVNESYRSFNDVGGFHESNKPWKRRNARIERALQKALR